MESERNNIVEKAHWLISEILKSLIERNELTLNAVKCLIESNIIFFISFFIRVPDLRGHYTERKDYKSRKGINILVKRVLLKNYQTSLLKAMDRSIREKQDLVVEKSTKMGATTTQMLLMLWYFLFKSNSRFLYIAPHHENIFQSYFIEKLTIKDRLIKEGTRFPVASIMCFIAGTVPNKLVDKSKLSLDIKFYPYNYLVMHNKANGSKIYLTNDTKKLNISKILGEDERRLTAIMLDEHAFHKNADYIWPQLQRYDCSRIITSSANGNNNLFYELRNREEMEIHKLHWLMNPRYSKQWYEGQKRTQTPEYIEQYLNINYDVKIKQIDKSLHKTKIKTKETVNKSICSLKKSTRSNNKLYKPRKQRISAVTNEPRKKFKGNKIAKIKDYKEIEEEIINFQSNEKENTNLDAKEKVVRVTIADLMIKEKGILKDIPIEEAIEIIESTDKKRTYLTKMLKSEIEPAIKLNIKKLNKVYKMDFQDPNSEMISEVEKEVKKRISRKNNSKIHLKDKIQEKISELPLSSDERAEEIKGMQLKPATQREIEQKPQEKNEKLTSVISSIEKIKGNKKTIFEAAHESLRYQKEITKVLNWKHKMKPNPTILNRENFLSRFNTLKDDMKLITGINRLYQSLKNEEKKVFKGIFLNVIKTIEMQEFYNFPGVGVSNEKLRLLLLYYATQKENITVSNVKYSHPIEKRIPYD